LSKRDDEIIAQYITGDHAKFVSEVANLLGGIDRVEGDYFIMANGTPVGMRPKSMFERWAEEEACRPADWLQVWSPEEK
jgi:hypothetical protein